jgi:hypothetical protein
VDVRPSETLDIVLTSRCGIAGQRSALGPERALQGPIAGHSTCYSPLMRPALYQGTVRPR